MSADFLARMMVSAVAAGQGVTPLFIDLSRTHATNPLWPGHARFHLVDETVVMTSMATVEIALLWWGAPDSRFIFYLVALLTALPIFGFLIAAITRKLYGGTLRDPNGVKALHLHIGDHTREIDVNLVLVIAGALVLLASVIIV